MTPEKLNQLNFKKLPEKVPNFGFIPHDVWFTFNIHNPTSKKAIFVLSLNNPNLDLVELIEYTGTKRPIGKSSSNQPFEEENINLESEDRLI